MRRVASSSQAAIDFQSPLAMLLRLTRAQLRVGCTTDLRRFESVLGDLLVQRNNRFYWESGGFGRDEMTLNELMGWRVDDRLRK